MQISKNGLLALVWISKQNDTGLLFQGTPYSHWSLYQISNLLHWKQYPFSSEFLDGSEIKVSENLQNTLENPSEFSSEIQTYRNMIFVFNLFIVFF